MGMNLMSSLATVLPATPSIWLAPQLPFWTIAHWPSANSAIESLTVLLLRSPFAVTELFV